ncbi:MAG: Thioredoxin reductase [Anaerolineales bacterium]|nr:Thioredoxin reductase [Anaerolineales bacterium]
MKSKTNQTFTTPQPEEKHRVIIIGGGPAGISAAIQLQRCGLRPLLLERRELGGLLWNANLVENYPGFPNGVRGEKLIGLMKKQVERLGAEVKREEARQVTWSEDDFCVETDCARRGAQYLIVAAGTLSRALPDVIAPETKGRVFTEVWPLANVTERKIVIVGAGDAAFDYALNLAQRGNFVTILNRGENVKCLELLFERAAQEERIEYRAGVAVHAITADKRAGRLEVRCEALAQGKFSLHAEYALFAIGRVPNLDFLSDEIRGRAQELVESGRLYFVGDVKNDSFRQAAIAAGDGLRAAMAISVRER